MMLFYCSSSTGPGDKNTVQLEEIDEVLPNPFKGFAPWIGGSNPVYEAKLQEATYGWRDLEPQKGSYKWSVLEKNWGNIAVTGKRVGFRIAAEIPGSGQDDVPQWLIDEGVAMRPYSIDGEMGLLPDWDDPKFLAAHHDFIMALGNRYDQDSRVAWIDIGSYGFWGEWHVWLNDSLAAKQSSKQAILEDYFAAFPTKSKVIAFDDDFATKYVTDHGGGIRNDCLGTQDANDWYLESLNGIDPTMNDQIWKRAFITGEFCGAEQGAIEGTTTRFDLNFEFIKQTHWSFIGPAGGAIEPQNDQHKQNLDELFKTLGYRFVLREVTHEAESAAGAKLDVSIKVENKGVAPFYFDWPLVISLANEQDSLIFQKSLDVDIRQWLPGLNTNEVQVALPSTLAVGEYQVKLAINDPMKDKPGVMFANTGKDDSGKYLVSYLTIK